MQQAQELPLVTVITPAYNRATLLEETILSVLNQDYAHIEYIVLDDGSTDETLQMMKQYEGRIRCETHPNMGEQRTVNKGFALANGEIIGIVNSDDPLLPRAISKIVARMLAEPDLIVVYPDWNMIDEHGNTLEHTTTYEYSYVDMVRLHRCLPGPCAFFRRLVVDKLQGRDTQFRYVADFDFWLRAGLIGPFARIPATLATWRSHPDSITAGRKDVLRARAKEHIRLINKLFALPNLPVEVLKVKREACSNGYYVAGWLLGEENFLAKKRYYLQALWHAPRNCCNDCEGRRFVMLSELLGNLYRARPLETLRQTLPALLPGFLYRPLRTLYRLYSK